ncbi:MAG: SGNH/GDSL hydrolase family protein [Alphaproteobacteria bacterium]
MLRVLGRVLVGSACGLLAAAILLVAVDAVVGRALTDSFSGNLAAIPYYARQPWTARFVADQDEIGSAKARYHPFIVWRRPPYASETVNVGPDGRRVVPGADCSSGTKKVWFFGGSTMWGTSSPDWGTIPAAFLAEMRKRTTMPLCVRNFGESAWSSTQEVIALVQALQAGEIPDLAVFYDGANDLNFAFENGHPYGHAELPKITAIFDREGRGRGARSVPERRPRDLLRWFAPNLAGRLDKAWPPWPAGGGGRRPAPDALARDTVRVLGVNREIVRALSQRFGFDVHFFWQPYLVAGLKPLAPGERKLMSPSNPRRRELGDMVARANAIVAAGLQPDETDLSRVFEATTEQVFTDPVHVTPEGNEIVARAMVGVLGDRVAAGPVSRSDGR